VIGNHGLDEKNPVAQLAEPSQRAERIFKVIQHTVSENNLEATECREVIAFQITQACAKAGVKLSESCDILVAPIDAEDITPVLDEELRKMTNTATYVHDALASERKAKRP
jgi:hypothetical protein